MLQDDIFKFDNSYASQLKGFYVPWKGNNFPAPAIVKLNTDLAIELGLDPSVFNTPENAAIFSGSKLPKSAAPLAQVYAGHQFGGFSPQLGDGRALLVGELIDTIGKRQDIQLKGSGPTPFSRGGDGKAALGPILREYLMGEAMHALNIPTTRALAVVTTGEKIMRDQPLPGAILTRVASSHLRVGTFQFFAARNEYEKVQQLADYAIQRHFPTLENIGEKYLGLLHSVIERQVSLIAKWMSVGFVHGVMNTDNMTISGETIDYGPCAFMDTYDPDTVFSSIDHQGRYAYKNQPFILQWNLLRFAETLIEIIDPDRSQKTPHLIMDIINTIPELYQKAWLNEMHLKLGLDGKGESDVELINDLHATMKGQNFDFTNLFRKLAPAAKGNIEPACALFDDPTVFKAWLSRWQNRINKNGKTTSSVAKAMDAANPFYIPRNHLVEEALQAAVFNNDLAPFNEFCELLKKPFTLQQDKSRFSEPAPQNFEPYKTFCGT